MMHQNSTFKVGRVAEDKIKVLELPYTREELSLFVLLPDDISGLAQVWAWQGKQKSDDFSGAWPLSDLLLSIEIPAAHPTVVLGRQRSTKSVQVFRQSLLGES